MKDQELTKQDRRNERIYNNIVKHTTSYLELNPNIESLIIGLSGGIDSTLVAAIMSEVCKKAGKNLIGYSLPIEPNKQPEVDNNPCVINAFCNIFAHIDLSEAYKSLYSSIINSSKRQKDNTIEEKIRCGNIKARIRMIYLYDRAHYHKGIVLSTDNLTELMLGFWTLHGDIGDFGAIQNLWKTEVYSLAKWLRSKYLNESVEAMNCHYINCKHIKSSLELKAQALDVAIKAIPTDGLGISESDLDQLGAKDYEEVDKVLWDYLSGKSTDINHHVVQRHLNSEYKRNNPYNISDRILFA